MKNKNIGHPIPEELLDSIDMITLRKDGSVELRIISSGYLDGDDITLNRITDKVGNYLQYINDDEYIEEFGAPSCDRTSIVLSCDREPNSSVLKLIDSIKEDVRSYNSDISVQYN